MYNFKFGVLLSALCFCIISCSNCEKKYIPVIGWHQMSKEQRKPWNDLNQLSLDLNKKKDAEFLVLYIIQIPDNQERDIYYKIQLIFALSENSTHRFSASQIRPLLESKNKYIQLYSTHLLDDSNESERILLKIYSLGLCSKDVVNWMLITPNNFVFLTWHDMCYGFLKHYPNKNIMKDFLKTEIRDSCGKRKKYLKNLLDEEG